MLRLADFFMRLEARLSYALIGLVQAAGYAGGLDYILGKTGEIQQKTGFGAVDRLLRSPIFCFQRQK